MKKSNNRSFSKQIKKHKYFEIIVKKINFKKYF